jgi:non-heme chloroperoxidase
MQSGLKNSYDCVKALSESDFTQVLQGFRRPDAVVHGEDDQVVPVANSMRSARLIKNAKDIYYGTAPPASRPPTKINSTSTYSPSMHS